MLWATRRERLGQEPIYAFGLSLSISVPQFGELIFFGSKVDGFVPNSTIFTKVYGVLQHTQHVNWKVLS